jgi:hypothetical protein
MAKSSRNHFSGDALPTAGYCARRQSLEKNMEKKIAGLLGAAAALSTLNAAQAAPTPVPSDVLRANSFADLLEPIPNAAEQLQAIDESAPPPPANVQLAQFYDHHHHHHHHHGFRRYGPRVMIVPPRYGRYYRHHHHHHHHHHSFYRRDY